jgi:hypothetical protein
MFKNLFKYILIEIYLCPFLIAGLPVTDGLVMHLDADSITGISDGAAIGNWSDVSGEGNPAVQTASSYKPRYSASSSAFNKPVVRFDGVDDFLDLNENMVHVGSFTVFIAAQFDNTQNGGDRYLISAQAGSGDTRLRIVWDAAPSPDRFNMRAGSSEALPSWAANADTAPHIFTLTSVMSGYLDGTYLGSTSNTSTLTPTALNLGSYGGEVYTRKGFFRGDVAEVILYNRVLSPEENNRVGYYLAEKYGMATAYVFPPVVTHPDPADGAGNVSVGTLLRWDVSGAPSSPVFDVYLDTDSSGLKRVSFDQSQMQFDPSSVGTLPYGKEIKWRIDVPGVPELGPVWRFTTHLEPLESLQSDLNQDGTVMIDDLRLLAMEWLAAGSVLADILPDNQVDMNDYSKLSSEYQKEAELPSSYVVSQGRSEDFNLFVGGMAAAIVTAADDDTVCHIAADLLADDIERVCGTKPQVTQDPAGLSGQVVFIGTLGKSALIDSLVASGKLDVSEVSGQWETFILQIVDHPIDGIEKGLFIVGSDRRGTAFGVFDLSEKMGVSPWYWWADVPVKHRDAIIIRRGRYQEGPPSVKYRGIFINDEDWGLHPWARNTYAPEDGYIGPKTYRKVFELLLRLKANYLWPAMHECTKAFNAFEDNKMIADQYAIVMGSSHCEQMLRNNVWEWYRWSPSDGSSRGDWDWCTNSAKITEYWTDRVKVNAPYENIYTMGMRGIHDSGMPCSGATDVQKAQAMSEEIFPAQRQMLADWVNPDTSKVPQIFCPYKEVLGLYNLDMQVPDDITLVWPDDNYGYIRRLSNSAEQDRSGRSGVYFHFSYLGPPNDYLWLCSTPPALIWEEMKKAYDYGADRVWVFNVGDIKPAEICTDFAMRMAWDIGRYDQTNIQSYLEQWAWCQFGREHKDQIAEIMVDYYRLGQTRKPEHMSAGGAAFSMIHYNDEMQHRIDAYESLDDKATAIYDSLPDACKDAFYELVLYPIRGAGLMNQKILYAQKSIQYAAQGRVSANQYAAMSQAAYQQIIVETTFYNESVANGKWKAMMSYNPLGRTVFGMPATSTVDPVSGSSMGVVLEGQLSEVADPGEPAQPFSDNFSDGQADGWLPDNAGRWVVRANGSRMEYAINTSDYSNLSGDRLGELSLVDGHPYDNFNFRCSARSCDSFSTNGSADFAIVFGYVDAMNYNYLIMSSSGSNSDLFRVIGGVRSQVQNVGVRIPDNAFHSLEIEKNAAGLMIRYNGQTVLTSTETFGKGLIGVGSYNDSAAFAEVEIAPLESSSKTLPGFDVFTQNKHFIDIFNKGNAAFAWTATPSAAWVRLDHSSGTIDAQQRIWVSIDWDQVPFGDNSSTIDITGAGTGVTVRLNAFNPASPRPDQLDGFVQSNGYVSIEAEHYSGKIDRNGAGWQAIATLGRSGDTMTIFPTTTQSREQISDIFANSPLLEYQVYLWEPGEQKVELHCIPTHAVTSEQGLRYAVAFDGQLPQIVGYDTVEWSSQWSLNVLQGAAVSESSHMISDPGEHTLKIWMVDPGVVIDKIMIGNAPASHLGPPETAIR